MSQLLITGTPGGLVAPYTSGLRASIHPRMSRPYCDLLDAGARRPARRRAGQARPDRCLADDRCRQREPGRALPVALRLPQLAPGASAAARATADRANAGPASGPGTSSLSSSTPASSDSTHNNSTISSAFPTGRGPRTTPRKNRRFACHRGRPIRTYRGDGAFVTMAPGRRPVAGSSRLWTTPASTGCDATPP
jgi:hypothetical protein